MSATFPCSVNVAYSKPIICMTKVPILHIDFIKKTLLCNPRYQTKQKTTDYVNNIQSEYEGHRYSNNLQHNLNILSFDQSTIIK